MAMFSLGMIRISIYQPWLSRGKEEDPLTTSLSYLIGLFMASQASIIACGTRKALLAMAMKFTVGPALMAVSSIAIGLKGTLFRVAIVQAALPQGIVPFVFAKEYSVHPDILSTGVIFGLLIAMPIALAYYFLLAL
ncbi:hypothetical protein F0562_005027 [Nyssa sinensis]|uniref:Auxin efflux carrier component n=1 Tax=Nyssa sinensis TaxID=561372 RepID=A0A5J5AJF5_9ASTE|nr:hypothetical protein F0562_005027 [Nyssa sinensis]